MEEITRENVIRKLNDFANYWQALSDSEETAVITVPKDLVEVYIEFIKQISSFVEGVI